MLFKKISPPTESQFDRAIKLYHQLVHGVVLMNRVKIIQDVISIYDVDKEKLEKETDTLEEDMDEDESEADLDSPPLDDLLKRL